MVSTRCFYAFGALISKEEAKRLEKLPHADAVLPDSYVHRETKDYGGNMVLVVGPRQSSVVKHLFAVFLRRVD